MASIVRASLGVLLEEEYQKQRAKAAEDLYNALADVLNAQRPSIETVIYVLEALKARLLNKEKAAQAPTPAAPAKVSGKVGWREARGMETDPPGK